LSAADDGLRIRFVPLDIVVEIIVGRLLCPVLELPIELSPVDGEKLGMELHHLVAIEIEAFGDASLGVPTLLARRLIDRDRRFPPLHAALAHIERVVLCSIIEHRL